MSSGTLADVPQIAVSVLPDPNDDRAVQAWVEADAAGTRLRLLLDTGSRLSSVPRIADLAAAEGQGTGSGRGLSGHASADELIRIRSLGLGDLTVDDVVVELQPAGWPHPPLLGTHVLEPYACAFRFSQGRLDLGVPDHPTGPVWGSSSTPGVELRWGDTAVTAVWDTGAGITIVDRTWARQHPEAVTVSHAPSGSPADERDHGTDATGHAVPGERGHLAGFTIQGTAFSGDQPCGIVDLSALNVHLTQPIHVFLGLPQIRQRDWLVDFPRRTIAILPT